MNNQQFMVTARLELGMEMEKTDLLVRARPDDNISAPRKGKLQVWSLNGTKNKRNGKLTGSQRPQVRK